MAVDSKQILTELDAEQLAVVTAIRGPVCVIAGAGTGKTRVITNRIAYAINSADLIPQSKEIIKVKPCSLAKSIPIFNSSVSC